jgi:hypothetical protein
MVISMRPCTFLTLSLFLTISACSGSEPTPRREDDAAANVPDGSSGDAALDLDADASEPDGQTAAGDATVTLDAAVPLDAAVVLDAAGDATMRDTPDAVNPEASVSCAPFPSFRRDCESSADCALAFRTFNCCGSQLVTGLRADALPAFNRAAQYCESLFPACGCATQATRADDGTIDDFSNSAHPNVTCQNQQCWSSFHSFSGRTPCGSEGLSCDAATELCKTTSGAGSSVISKCVAVPQACSTNRTCKCLGSGFCTGAASECSEDPFANGVTCACTRCQ